MFRTVEAIADTGAPTLVMTYWNPSTATESNVSPATWPPPVARADHADLIPEEAEPWLAASDAHDLDRVFLVAPSSTDERIALTSAAAAASSTPASLMGVTGARDRGRRRARRWSSAPEATTLPVGVGLGVSDGAQAAEVAGFADGVIVGSAFIRRLLDNRDLRKGVDAVRELAAELADGVRQGSKAR